MWTSSFLPIDNSIFMKNADISRRQWAKMFVIARQWWMKTRTNIRIYSFPGKILSQGRCLIGMIHNKINIQFRDFFYNGLWFDMKNEDSELRILHTELYEMKCMYVTWVFGYLSLWRGVNVKYLIHYFFRLIFPCLSYNSSHWRIHWWNDEIKLNLGTSF